MKRRREDLQAAQAAATPPPGPDALVAAARAGREDEVRRLLADARLGDPGAHDNRALRVAARHGNVGVMRWLLGDVRVDPAARGHAAFLAQFDRSRSTRVDASSRMAAVRLLLADPRTDPGAANNLALLRSVEDDCLDLVRLLLADERVDPSQPANRPLKQAILLGHLGVLQCLLGDARVTPGPRSFHEVGLRAGKSDADDAQCARIVAALLDDGRCHPSNLTDVDLARFCPLGAGLGLAAPLIEAARRGWPGSPALLGAAVLVSASGAAAGRAAVLTKGDLSTDAVAGWHRRRQRLRATIVANVPANILSARRSIWAAVMAAIDDYDRMVRRALDGVAVIADLVHDYVVTM